VYACAQLVQHNGRVGRKRERERKRERIGERERERERIGEREREREREWPITETCTWVTRDQRIMKRDLYICEKRPTHAWKETNTGVKRDL